MLGDKDRANTHSKLVVGGLCLDPDKAELLCDGDLVKAYC